VLLERKRIAFGPFIEEYPLNIRGDRLERAMPMLFSPTIGAAIKAGYWFLRRAALPAAPPAMSTCGRSTGTPALP
jgi:hypothetical protein